MTTWFTADLHLGHANIIRYCARPFPDVAAMNEGLLGRWNDTVGATDTVWVLGDVALGPIDRSLDLVARLAGRKVLVTGNHDRCWKGHGPGARSWVRRYEDAGFAEVHQGEIDLDISAGVPVKACHFPFRGDSGDEDRYPAHRPADRGEWLLHGHVHDRWRQWDRMINVGVDAWDYRPVNVEVIRSLIGAGPMPDPSPAYGPQPDTASP